ncbi:HypC/HybG/HupF family hydrogenase formation chaperone [Candidatus Magnetominusculus dajiuhuensis]|uniref:HypC/HybG/HupF family hydrogenase formation chaperone n=1 Tax=Candidatus Magnetominusculus dajiuhuensis TaxID=3137712 RepID=UPI003B431CD9
MSAMCLAVPVEVVEIDGARAIIDTGGVRRAVSLLLLPDAAAVGDFVLVHAGFAIQKMDSSTGNEIINLFREIEQCALPFQNDSDA